MGLSEEYLKLQMEYTEKYGINTVILYQVGSFYEIYEYDPDLDPNEIKYNNKKIGNATRISKILNMCLTQKNKKKPHGINNPILVGFPTASYENHKNILLSNNFTIVRVEQEQENVENTEIKRNIKEIISPGTEIEDISILPLTNNIVSIYLECQNTNIQCNMYTIICGVSSIDLSCGKSQINEYYSREVDKIYALHETYRFLLTQSPREILINIAKIPNDKIEEYKTFIYKELGLDKYSNIIIRENKINNEYYKLEYQEKFLENIFDDNKNTVNIKYIKIKSISSIQKLDLERYYYGRISYMVLLEYCYQHNENLIQKLDKPICDNNEESRLILAHNSILQLNLIPQKRIILDYKI